mgnify:CR=1 FL=1
MSRMKLFLVLGAAWVAVLASGVALAGSRASGDAEESGCSATSSSAPGSGLAIAMGVGAAVAAISRSRRRSG